VGSRIHGLPVGSQPNNIYDIVIIVLENHWHFGIGVNNDIPTGSDLFIYDSGLSNKFRVLSSLNNVHISDYLVLKTDTVDFAETSVRPQFCVKHRDNFTSDMHIIS
jgi:hypothetical protein